MDRFGSYRQNQRGGYSGNEEDDDNGDEVNGDKVDGGVLQWRAATRNGAALTLVGYNWEVVRGAMLQWWDGWVTERADGNCGFPLVLLGYILKSYSLLAF